MSEEERQKIFNEIREACKDMQKYEILDKVEVTYTIKGEEEKVKEGINLIRINQSIFDEMELEILRYALLSWGASICKRYKYIKEKIDILSDKIKKLLKESK